LSAYAFMNDMPCHIWVAASIRPEKLVLIKMFHPQLHVVAEGYEEAVRLSNSQMEEEGIYNANPGSCRAKIVGNAAIGREMAGQIRLIQVQPTIVVCPANNGTHILGVWEGVRETFPDVRMVGAVAPQTEVADSIGGFHRFEGQALSRMVEDSQGRFVTVSDAELQAATLELVRHGFVVEPAAAASVAALTHLDLTSSDVVCCTITGSGMKYPSLMAAVLGEEKARLPKSRTRRPVQ
jgi:threonine synthase